MERPNTELTIEETSTVFTVGGVRREGKSVRGWWEREERYLRGRGDYRLSTSLFHRNPKGPLGKVLQRVRKLQINYKETTNSWEKCIFPEKTTNKAK